MQSGEFTVTYHDVDPAIQVSDLAIDSHESPALVKVTLRRAKTDHFARGIDIYFGKTDTPICPVVGLLRYMAVCPKGDESTPLLVHADGSPLTREQFLRMVKKTLHLANIDQSAYSGHSFRIGAASSAAAAGVPAYFIKMLGRWESEAYHLYIKTPCASLASVSQLLAQ